MDNNIFGCFVSGPSLNHDSTLREQEFASERGEAFRQFIWGDSGLDDQIKQLKHQTYGKDLVLILFQFYLNPSPFELKNLEEIESYRRKERSIGIPVIITEENFFLKVETAKLDFIKNRLIEKLNLLDIVIKRNKLDTNLQKLKSDFRKLLTS